jgi:hypothetical protein
MTLMSKKRKNLSERNRVPARGLRELELQQQRGRRVKHIYKKKMVFHLLHRVHQLALQGNITSH